MASIYHSMDAPLQAATAPAQGQLDKLPPATSCCFGATTLLIGIKLSCLWYMFKAFFAVVVPVLFSLNMKDGWGGIDGRDEHFCQFPGGNCPTIAATMCSPGESMCIEARHEMYMTMYDEAHCQKWHGTFVEVDESLDDHSMGDQEIWFTLRLLTIVLTAICSGFNFHSLQNGSNEFIAPFLRALLVLIAIDLVAEIFSVMAISDACNDSGMTAHMHCVLTQGVAATSAADPAMQCEMMQGRFDLITFLLNFGLNFYILWIVYSYEKTIRGASRRASLCVLAAPFADTRRCSAGSDSPAAPLTEEPTV